VLGSDDTITVRKSGGGGIRDFDQLFTDNYSGLAQVLYRVVGDTSQAEELAAETFWKLHRNPPASGHSLGGWLYRTGIRLALDALKKQKRRTHYEALTPERPDTQNPEQLLELRQQQDRVRVVLAAIKPQQASLLLLRSHGFSLGEIAARLELNRLSVGTFMARAEAAFRKEYVKRHGEK